MLEDTTLTVVMLAMTAIMAIGLIGIRNLKAGNRKLEAKNKEKRRSTTLKKRVDEVQLTA